MEKTKLAKEFEKMSLEDRKHYMCELAQRMDYAHKERKNGQSVCIYLSTHTAHTQHFCECFIHTDYKKSNKFELWTATEIETSDAVQLVSVHKSWTLCYTYLVDRAYIEKLLKHIKVQNNTDSNERIVITDYMNARQIEKHTAQHTDSNAQ